MTVRPARAVVLAVILAAAVPSGAVVAGERYGAALNPVPLIVEHWDDPAVTLTNIGDLVIHATIVIEGDGWALAASTFRDIAPKATVRAPVATTGTGEARIVATVTTDAAGMDRQVLVLESSARHVQWWETIPWALILLAAVLVACGASWAILRGRRRARAA